MDLAGPFHRAEGRQAQRPILPQRRLPFKSGFVGGHGWPRPRPQRLVRRFRPFVGRPSEAVGWAACRESDGWVLRRRCGQA
jgi:hypothetical protein